MPKERLGHQVIKEIRAILVIKVQSVISEIKVLLEIKAPKVSKVTLVIKDLLEKLEILAMMDLMVSKDQ